MQDLIICGAPLHEYACFFVVGEVVAGYCVIAAQIRKYPVTTSTAATNAKTTPHISKNVVPLYGAIIDVNQMDPMRYTGCTPCTWNAVVMYGAVAYSDIRGKVECIQPLNPDPCAKVLDLEILYGYVVIFAIDANPTNSCNSSNSNYELEFCLAHTIIILCEYLTRYKVKK